MFNKNNKLEISFKNKNSHILLGEYLKPFFNEDTIVVCIGTDKCIGDSLGPLVGTFLEKKNFSCPVYGTLKSPIHALNIYEKITYIKKKHSNSFIVAIDACLSDTGRIGNIEVRTGSISPGKGIGKKLPSIGDLSIVGIVDNINDNNCITLHSIRLSFIMEMAETIVNALLLATNEKTVIV